VPGPERAQGPEPEPEPEPEQARVRVRVRVRALEQVPVPVPVPVLEQALEPVQAPSNSGDAISPNRCLLHPAWCHLQRSSNRRPRRWFRLRPSVLRPLCRWCRFRRTRPYRHHSLHPRSRRVFLLQ